MSSIESDIDNSRARSAPPRKMVVPLVILLVAVAVVLGGVHGCHLFVGGMMKKYMGAAAQAPQTVSTAVATKSSWQSQTQAIGSLRAVRGADLAAQAAGIVETLHMESGKDVAAGEVLMRLRPNDDPAKLEQLQAAAALAEQTYKRDQEQLAAQAISQAVLDTDVSNLKSARAQVIAQQALIDEKIVRAPFAGRLGIRQVDEGQYLTAGTTVVTLQALDPILIDFYVPQQALAHVRVGQKAVAAVDTFPKEQFTGTIDSINSKVDSASRNVQVRASFPNVDHRLLPGMYASVYIDDGDPVDRITLPQSAITYNPYGDTVFVIERSGKDPNGKPQAHAQQRFVQLGATRGDQVAVLDGLKEGEEVVTGGQMKLRNGVPVTVDNSVTPANDARPTPPNE
ncbi:MAG TPA: efflux RND transporter periplasmic adaptor subunit [Steroidobacteraceae bacterium]|nr:efflux RND transporter periplasmic adaptor subunit [Steroidobacteraceae bacterium]